MIVLGIPLESNDNDGSANSSRSSSVQSERGCILIVPSSLIWTGSHTCPEKLAAEPVRKCTIHLSPM
jgi:hypothetical protein